jgi:D-alanine-D-alanine ligase
MKIAVVRNACRDGVISTFGQPCPERYDKKTLQAALDALRGAGHEVALLEGDKTLAAELERLLPTDPATGRPGGLALNLAYGIQGQSRYTHVPALLEMLGVPYTGAGPLGHAVSLDKAIAKTLMRAAGVPTPASAVMDRPGQPAEGLRFPLVVKPLHESTSFGLSLVHDPRQLDQAVQAVIGTYGQAALVEEFVEGREVCVALLGNDPPQTLPAVELDFKDRDLQLMTWDDKYHRRADEPEKRCPAPLPDPLLVRCAAVARVTFEACHAHDYARVDIRIDRAGQPHVLEINTMASLGRGGSFARAAQAAGYTFETLVRTIVDVAHLRYFGTPAHIGSPEPQRSRRAHSAPAPTSRPDGLTGVPAG